MFSCRQSTCKLSPRTRNRSPGLLAVAKLPQDFWMESNFPNGQGVVLASPLGQGDSPGPDDPSSLRPPGLRRSGTLRQDGRRPHFTSVASHFGETQKYISGFFTVLLGKLLLLWVLWVVSKDRNLSKALGVLKKNLSRASQKHDWNLQNLISTPEIILMCNLGVGGAGKEGREKRHRSGEWQWKTRPSR